MRQRKSLRRRQPSMIRSVIDTKSQVLCKTIFHRHLHYHRHCCSITFPSKVLQYGILPPAVFLHHIFMKSIALPNRHRQSMMLLCVDSDGSIPDFLLNQSFFFVHSRMAQLSWIFGAISKPEVSRERSYVLRESTSVNARNTGLEVHHAKVRLRITGVSLLQKRP